MNSDKVLFCGVKFCGGCNPRYDRLAAFEKVKSLFKGEADFFYAEDGESYDLLLVIGGCPSCCASYDMYKAGRVVKMWDENHIESIL